MAGPEDQDPWQEADIRAGFKRKNDTIAALIKTLEKAKKWIGDQPIRGVTHYSGGASLDQSVDREAMLLMGEIDHTLKEAKS